MTYIVPRNRKTYHRRW